MLVLVLIIYNPEDEGEPLFLTPQAVVCSVGVGVGVDHLQP